MDFAGDVINVDILLNAKANGLAAFKETEAQLGSMGKAGQLAGGLMGGGMLLGAAGAGVLFEGLKGVTENAEKNERATLSLEQAYASQHLELKDYGKTIDKFIDTNKKYISSTYEVKEGYAFLTRSGMEQNMVQRTMNDAVNLSAISHISLKDAVEALQKGELGRLKGLIGLGITTQEVAAFEKAHGDTVKDVATAEHNAAKAADTLTAAKHALLLKHEELAQKHKTTALDMQRLQDLEDKVTKATDNDTEAKKKLAAAHDGTTTSAKKGADVLDLLEPKLVGAKEHTTALAQRQHELNTNWETFSNRVGPLFIQGLSEVTGELARLSGDLMTAWDRASGFLGALGRVASSTQSSQTHWFNAPPPQGGQQGHAEGGVFSTPHFANVAEAGPEAIIPLSNPQRAGEVMREAGLSGAGSQDVVQRLDALIAILSRPQPAPSTGIEAMVYDLIQKVEGRRQRGLRGASI